MRNFDAERRICNAANTRFSSKLFCIYRRPSGYSYYFAFTTKELLVLGFFTVRLSEKEHRHLDHTFINKRAGHAMMPGKEKFDESRNDLYNIFRDALK